MVFGLLMVVVKMKNVINKNPKSTIGVRSILVLSFLAFFTPGPFFPPPEVSISAMLFYFLFIK
jgi:hypothetical protein